MSTVPPRLRPAGAIDGSHAALTSTASYLGREAVRDVFPSAGEKAAPPFFFVVDRRTPSRHHGSARQAAGGTGTDLELH